VICFTLQSGIAVMLVKFSACEGYVWYCMSLIGHCMQGCDLWPPCRCPSYLSPAGTHKVLELWLQPSGGDYIIGGLPVWPITHTLCFKVHMHTAWEVWTWARVCGHSLTYIHHTRNSNSVYEIAYTQMKVWRAVWRLSEQSGTSRSELKLVRAGASQGWS